MNDIVVTIGKEERHATAYLTTMSGDITRQVLDVPAERTIRPLKEGTNMDVQAKKSAETPAGDVLAVVEEAVPLE